jgi:hypothetical protein
MAPDTLFCFADSEDTTSVVALTDDSGCASGMFAENRSNTWVI